MFPTEIARISCSCYGEEIGVDFDEDPVPQTMLAFWQHGFEGQQPLAASQRLRWALQVLFKGKPYTDMVLLNQEETVKLRDALNVIIKKMEAKKDGTDNDGESAG